MSIAEYINPHILIWARKEQGLSLSFVENKTTLKKVRLWEEGLEKPTMNQLMSLAHVYRRPSALFFMKKPPEIVKKMTDFRTMKDRNEGELSPETITEIRVCESRRYSALELAETMGAGCSFKLPELHLDHETEKVATEIRELLHVDISRIAAMKNEKEVLEYWINHLEQSNILVFRSKTLNGWNPSFREIRGSSAYYDEFPWILLNSQEHPRGQLFTLGHELAHLLLHASGVCTMEEDESSAHVQIERYCNGFSAALLMPYDRILETVKRRQLVFSSKVEIDLSVGVIQKTFHVSREAVARRLVSLKYINLNDYRRIREEQIEALVRERSLKQEEEGGGGKYYYKRVLAWNGFRYTSMVIEAFHRKAISLGAAASYLRTKVGHFETIERELYG